MLTLEKKTSFFRFPMFSHISFIGELRDFGGRIVGKLRITFYP